MFRFEKNLVNTFIKLKKFEDGYIKECPLRWGNIDIVEYETKALNYLSSVQIEALTNRANLMIFSLLYQKQPHTLNYLLKRMNIDKTELIKRIKKLENCNIIEVHDHLYSINKQIDFPDITVTAYEMKLYNIKKAINQAVINKRYTDYSYVVLPYDRYNLAMGYKDVFQNNSIGLVLVKEDKLYEVIRPKRVKKMNNSKLISKLKLVDSLELYVMQN